MAKALYWKSFQNFLLNYIILILMQQNHISLSKEIQKMSYYGMTVSITQTLRSLLKIIETSHDHSIKAQDTYQSNKMTCDACAIGKLIIKSLSIKIDNESLKFLERI